MKKKRKNYEPTTIERSRGINSISHSTTTKSTAAKNIKKVTVTKLKNNLKLQKVILYNRYTTSKIRTVTKPACK